MSRFIKLKVRIEDGEELYGFNNVVASEVEDA